MLGRLTVETTDKRCMHHFVFYFVCIAVKLEERMPSAEEREKKWEERLRKQHAVAQLVYVD